MRVMDGQCESEMDLNVSNHVLVCLPSSELPNHCKSYPIRGNGADRADKSWTISVPDPVDAITQKRERSKRWRDGQTLEQKSERKQKDRECQRQ